MAAHTISARTPSMSARRSLLYNFQANFVHCSRLQDRLLLQHARRLQRHPNEFHIMQIRQSAASRSLRPKRRDDDMETRIR